MTHIQNSGALRLEDKWQSGMVTQMEADIEAVNSAVKQTLI
jgi:hypothetical protein